MYSKLLRETPRFQAVTNRIKCHNVPIYDPYRKYTDATDPKGPTKEEKIESLKMPGFVHPDTMNEEGYFTQKAKQQLEELKKKMDKPKVENTERKE